MPEFNPRLIETPSRRNSVLIATGILIAVAVLLAYFNPLRKPELAITRVQTYVARSETKEIKDTNMHVLGMAPHVDNDLYVVITVRLTNKTHFPLFVKDETAVLTSPDHSILESSAIQKADLAQIYAAFPELQALTSTPLARDTEIAPGQAAEGMVLLHFPGATEANWNPRESATLTLDFFKQASLTIPISEK